MTADHLTAASTLALTSFYSDGQEVIFISYSSMLRLFLKNDGIFYVKSTHI